jgi:hypothetical protein
MVKLQTILILVFLGLVITIIGTQGLTLYNQEVYLPRYYTGECIPRADNMQELDLSEIKDYSGAFYECTPQATSKWIPQVNGIQCEYIIDETGFTSLTHSAYECPLETNKDEIKDECIKLNGKFGSTDSETTYVVDAGKKLYVNADRVLGLGSTKIRAKYPSYGIQFESPDGYKTSTSLTCLARGVDNKYHPLDLNERIEIIPDVPLNVVVGLQKAYSSQVVEIDDVNNGKPIYITRPEYYYKINTAEDGFEYVDTAQGEYYDKDIECIPRTTGCSDDAKIILLEDQSCDKYGGAMTDYSPVQGDSSRLCKYSCKNGKLSLTNDCIDVVSDCPDDKPLWDSTTGKCVALDIPEEEEANPLDMTVIYIITITVFIALLMLAINKKRGGR